MILLVDTNVFLDVVLKRNELLNESLSFLKETKVNNDKIYVNASSLKDIYYFAYKKFHDKKIAQTILVDIYSNISKVISLHSDDAIESFYLDGDFEDNCLIESAKRTMCDAIITRNTKDFKDNGIPILTPSDYLRHR